MAKDIKGFQRQLLQLEPVEFIGVARILGVQLFDVEKNEPMMFDEIFADMMEKYAGLSRKQRRNLERLLRAATKKEDDSND